MKKLTKEEFVAKATADKRKKELAKKQASPQPHIKYNTYFDERYYYAEKGR